MSLVDSAAEPENLAGAAFLSISRAHKHHQNFASREHLILMNPRAFGWVRALRQTPLHPQWLLPTRTAVQELAIEWSKGTVLDIGCADRWIERVLPADRNYIGLDYPPTGDKLYHAVPDCFGNALNLPFGAGTIDTVLLLDVLEHLSDPGRALDEAFRILKPGGSIVVSVPFLYPVHDAPFDFQRLTTYGLTHALTQRGFSKSLTTQYSRSAEVVGLFVSLWIGGLAFQCWQRKKIALIIALPLLALVPAVNLCAWLAARVLPDWPAIYGGVNAVAKKDR